MAPDSLVRVHPSARVLDLFAVPATPHPIPGGSGHSVVAGDLVLSPGRDPGVCQWLNPTLARLAVTLDEEPGRQRRDLRLAMPVPARNGDWVVEGWGASRFEPDTTRCDDPDVLLAAGRLLHARLASWVEARPPRLADRGDRWALAERAAFGSPTGRWEAAATNEPSPDLADLLDQLGRARTEESIGPDQLVHADLAGNLLLDAGGAPLVIDLAPAWRPVLWAEAVAVLDAVLWHGADAGRVAAFGAGAPRQAMLRAALFRLLSDEPADVARYRAVLSPVL